MRLRNEGLLRTYISWEQVNTGLMEIVRDCYLDEFKPTAIVYIPRGGCNLGVMLSHYFDVDLISISDFIESPTKGVLIIDEICDSGKTLANYKEILKDTDAKWAVLQFNITQDVVDVDYWGYEFSRELNSNWFVYPWEEWWKQ